jgi:hypothetical protein
MLKKCAMLAALALLLSPASARADWLFTPNIGTTFGGSTNGNEHFGYGASIGWMGAGIFGWEADFAYTPEFFAGNDDEFNFTSTSNATSFMVNAIVGAPAGGTTGGGFRPYFSGGLGLLQTQLESPDELFEISNNDFGVNLGGGAMGFMTDHVGFRGDVRYYRALTDPEPDNEFDIDFGSFNFWRATGGVTFRW